jgi:AmmeMemoRadiSam system protein B
MAGPKQGTPTVRPPAVAGTFYPAEAQACRALATSYLEHAPGVEGAGKNWIGGIVPHAGWVCSGAIAGRTIAALAAAGKDRKIDVVVVFGAVHSATPLDYAALDSHTRWGVPGGESELPEELERKLTEIQAKALFRVDDRFHHREHAVEVELPLIQVAWPGVSVLPIEVPAISRAVEIGVGTAKTLQDAGLSAVYLASSDLTHYGPGYDFTPAGVGLAALQWARGNDRRLLDRVTRLSAEEVVNEARSHLNACGGGAIAAMLGACRVAGATHAEVLQHANSYEVLRGISNHGPENAVGYAAVVVG